MTFRGGTVPLPSDMIPSRRAYFLPDDRLIARFHEIWRMAPGGQWCGRLNHDGPVEPKDAVRHPRPDPRACTWSATIGERRDETRVARA